MWRGLCGRMFLKLRMDFQGLGNMAVSNAFGSNTFNIFIALSIPWAVRAQPSELCTKAVFLIEGCRWARSSTARASSARRWMAISTPTTSPQARPHTSARCPCLCIFGPTVPLRCRAGKIGQSCAILGAVLAMMVFVLVVTNMKLTKEVRLAVTHPRPRS